MLKSLRIRTKLLLSFISMLVLITGVGFIGKMAIDNGAQSSANLQAITSIEALFNQARVAEKSFAASTDPSFKTSVHSNIQELKNTADTLARELTHKDASAANRQVKRFATEYLEAFDLYATKSQAREAAMEQMVAASNDAFVEVQLLQDALNAQLQRTIESRDLFEDAFTYEDALATIMTHGGQTQTINLLFLNARKFEKEHIISNNELFLERARQSIEGMRTLLSDLIFDLDSESLIERAEEAQENVEVYSKNFDHHANLMAEQQRLSSTMEEKAGAARDACASAAATIKASNSASIKLSQMLLLGITLTAIIIGIVFAITISRGIALPLEKTVAMINNLAHGHLDQRLNLERGDEIGTLANTMDSFADSLEREVVEPLNQLARGDLTFSVTPYDSNDSLRTALQKLGQDLNDIMLDIQVSGSQISQGSNQVADSSQALSQGATEQASSLQQISSSLHEVSDQTQRNANASKEASTLTNQVRSDATTGTEHMQQLNEAMAEITKASRDISNIIKAIDEIAFQTNLLALNAAVEAARAGQHGKGFAVVAEEVRNLAGRSAKAARETTELIQGSVDKADYGAEVAEKTRQSLDKIVSGVTKASTLVAEISTASTEQAEAINQISIGVAQIDDVTQQNTASVEETAAAATQLSSQAENLQQMLSRFVLKDNELASFAPSAFSEDHRQPRLEGYTGGDNSTEEQDPWGNHFEDDPIHIALDDDSPHRA